MYANSSGRQQRWIPSVVGVSSGERELHEQRWGVNNASCGYEEWVKASNGVVGVVLDGCGEHQ